MKRAALCVPNPEKYINQLDDYSIMIINPNAPISRQNYLLDNADWSLLITESDELHRDGADYGNERLYWYTSGTTGDSKFCSFTQAQLDTLANTIVNSYNLTNNDRYVSIMPLWHAHGQGFYWATKLAKCETVFLSVTNIRLLPNFCPTFITAIPDVLKVVQSMNLTDLRFVRSASAPLSNTLYNDLKMSFNIPIIEAFGMTEALSHCFTNPLRGPQRIGTIGLPDGIDAEIVDNQLYIRGPTLATPGWYNTGDLASQDSAGYYQILGRHKDQINIKGKKLNPVSLESQLMTNIPGLVECVIFGSSSVNCLYVGDIDPTEIKKYLLSIGSHSYPKLVMPVDEIPLSPSGKISRSWLEKQYATIF